MGLYRLLLAYMVLYSHMFQPIMGFQIGVVAVISFLLISGFVMTALIEKHYFSINLIGKFYLDRMLRLLPQFYFYALLIIFCAHYLNLRQQGMPHEPTFQSIILQLLVVPINFNYQFSSLLIPQAWSLGLEITFYVLFPFVLIFNKRLIVLVTSFIFFLFTYFEFLNVDTWGYRFLPGTFFIFISGSFLYDASKREKFIPVVICCLAIVLLVMTYFFPSFQGELILIKRSILAGIIFGVPAIATLKYLGIKNTNKFSLGDLSYGVFLNHNFVIGLFVLILGSAATQESKPEIADLIIALSLTITVSTIFSFVSYHVAELPFVLLKKKQRAPSV
jgi:peptidoglycan/LPS O-acetylase OafA/YrhL